MSLQEADMGPTALEGLVSLLAELGQCRGLENRKEMFRSEGGHVVGSWGLSSRGAEHFCNTLAKVLCVTPTSAQDCVLNKAVSHVPDFI